MEKRKLGKYGVKVSPIGIGAMSFSNFYGRTNEEESHKILVETLDQGISHIDTVNVYVAGASEAAICCFIANRVQNAMIFFQLQLK